VAKDPPKKPGKPAAAGESSTPDVTSSQILSTRPVDQPPLPPPPVRSQRRSTTHGVGWYATEEEDDDLTRPRRKRGRIVFVAALLAVVVGGLAGALVWMRTRKPAAVAAPSLAPPARADAAPPAPDAAPARMVRLALASTPPGADFVVDGKPVGKAPLEIDVPEKATVVVEATLAQFQPWREQVEVTPKGKKVMARLLPVAGVGVVDAGGGAAGADAAVEKAAAAPAKKTATPARKPVKKKVVPAKAKKKRPTRR